MNQIVFKNSCASVGACDKFIVVISHDSCREDHARQNSFLAAGKAREKMRLNKTFRYQKGRSLSIATLFKRSLPLEGKVP